MARNDSKHMKNNVQSLCYKILFFDNYAQICLNISFVFTRKNNPSSVAKISKLIILINQIHDLPFQTSNQPNSLHE